MDALNERKICDVFGIESLYSHQKVALYNVGQRKDVLVSTKTSSGKSLCYQALPVYLRKSVLVFSPLNSIMDDQMKFLNAVGLNTTVVGREEKDFDLIKSCVYDIMFTSPETVLNCERWRNVLLSQEFRRSLCAIVVDEAHTVVQWGEGKKGTNPFREWFGKIGEVRSLCPDVPMLVLTATASKSSRKDMSRILCLKHPVELVESPDRDNIKLNVKIEKSSLKEDVMFEWLMDDLVSLQQELPRHIIFCKTIKDCAKLYTMFRMNTPTGMQHVQMFHSCTCDSVKYKIIEDMKDEKGTVRVLICTNAAGMGVNFKGVDHVVNFGPPHDMDSFLQQIGRAGRSGERADHLLLTTRQQLRNADQELKDYALNANKCRRSVLLENYSAENSGNILRHMCCDICVCDCGSSDCKSEAFVHLAHRYVKNDSDSEEEMDYDSDCTDLYDFEGMNITGIETDSD